MLPDNLSPTEMAQLHKLLADNGVDITMGELEEDVAARWVPGKGFPTPKRGEAAPADVDEPVIDSIKPIVLRTALLDDGVDVWQGHQFKLTEARLKAIRKIVASQIADDLKAEIGRLNEMP